MKTLIFIASLLILIGCNTVPHHDEQSSKSIDIQSELAGIEKTRNAFMKALKEKDFESLGNVVTRDVKTVTPGGSGWLEMFRINAHMGPFPYDSIIMYPKETVVVSDSVAYDFGNSKVYYTDEEGKVVELGDTFLAILKKGKDGTWRLHREVASSKVE
jgi:ketosteroid isomerase-like protein